jgi:plasmid stabilization system protein ParE
MRYMLRVDSRAENEIFAAMTEVGEAKAERFVAEIERIVDTVLDFPKMYPTLKVVGVKTNIVVRRALIQGFSYGLIYTVIEEQEVVRFLCCYHVRSNPNAWLAPE